MGSIAARRSEADRGCEGGAVGDAPANASRWESKTGLWLGLGNDAGPRNRTRKRL